MLQTVKFYFRVASDIENCNEKNALELQKKLHENYIVENMLQTSFRNPYRATTY